MNNLAVSEEAINADSLVDACLDYYSRFCSHNCCYDDLKEFVEEFTAEQQAVFLRSIEILGTRADEDIKSDEKVGRCLLIFNHADKTLY